MRAVVLDAIPARRHADIHERHRVGPAFSHGAPDHFETLLALVGGLQLEADVLARRHRLAEERGFHIEGFVGGVLAGEDLFEIAVNGAVVVNDEDAEVLFKRGWIHGWGTPIFRAVRG